VTGAVPGDEVSVWFEAGGVSSAPFTYRLVSATGNPVLILAVEDYTGEGPVYAKTDGPSYLDAYREALTSAEIDFDVYDFDAMGRRAPSALGVLGHYWAVVWYTGDDVAIRDPGMAQGTTSRATLELMQAVRAYLNEGGKVVYSGKSAGLPYYQGLEFDPVANAPCDPDDNGEDRCDTLSNDFMQYYMGAASTSAGTALGGDRSVVDYPANAWGPQTPMTGLALRFGPPGAANQDSSRVYRATSQAMPAETYPHFRSAFVARLDQPGSRPHTGEHTLWSGSVPYAYQRLMRTVDFTGTSQAGLDFWIARETRQPFDAVIVEAHTPGLDDWTTLPDGNGHTTQQDALSCTSPTWFALFPHLVHYMTPDTTVDPPTCAPTGTTGAWHAATSYSDGWEHWSVDLGAWAGRQVEVSITYVRSRIPFTGVFLDDVSLSTGESTSFEDGLGGWTLSGLATNGQPHAADFKLATAADYPPPTSGPVVLTADTVLLGFGLEGIAEAAQRRDLVERLLGHLLGPTSRILSLPPRGASGRLYLPSLQRR